MKIVTYGGGTNSTAMIIGMVKQGIIPDRILFSDTGGERPDTYAFIDLFSGWLVGNGAPAITKLHYTDKNGEPLTLEQDCLEHQALPGIAYGFKSCSQKFKTRVADKFCNNDPDCKAVWGNGERIDKYIGYDAGEPKRVECHKAYDLADKKYNNHYPLYDWGWTRERCVEEILSVGLPKPGKSSCFFCPSMKKAEIEDLWKRYPDLFKRAMDMEANAAPKLEKIKGLGRNWSWTDFYNAKINEPEQLTLFDFAEQNISCGCLTPCGCFD